MKPLNHGFQRCKTLSELVEPVSRNGDPNVTQNLHVCTICCRPEADYNVVSGRNIKIIEGYLVVNFEVAISNSFRDIFKKSLRDSSEAAEADIEDSIKRKRIRVSLKNYW